MSFRFSCGIVLAGLLSISATGQTADEYRVKAAFLYNFTKFVEWPAQAFKSSTEPFVICILGKNPFGNLVNEAVSGKTVEGRAFSVLEITEVAQARFCHILFVSDSQRKRLGPIFDAVKGSGTLTVGETDGFAALDGVINFKIVEGNVRLQINMDAVARQQLHISAKLLSLAEIVRK
jgi:hypothetical protein